MAAKRIPPRHEAALGAMMMGKAKGLLRFTMQAKRRVFVLQQRRKTIRRQLKVVNDELKIAKQQLRAITRELEGVDVQQLDGELPKA